MAITYSAAQGTVIDSHLVEQLLPAQQDISNRVDLVATSALPSGTTGYQGNVGTGANGIGDNYVGRLIILRPGTATEEIRVIRAATFVTNRVQLTVNENWNILPAGVTDTVYVPYEPGDIEDGGAGGGINLNTKTGLYELSNTLTIQTDGGLQILNGNALELDDRGNALALTVASTGWLYAGLAASGASIGGGITPSYNNTAGEPTVQIASGGHCRIYDTLLWSQLVPQSYECVAGNDAFFQDTKWLGLTQELTLYSATIRNCSISGRGTTSEIARFDSNSDVNGLVIASIQNIDSIANTTTETITLKNALFTGVPGYINVRDNKTWNMVNVVWRATSFANMTRTGTGSASVNISYSLDTSITDASGSAITSGRVFVYEGTTTDSLVVDTTVDGSGNLSTSWAYQQYNWTAGTGSNLTYGNHIIRAYAYGFNPFVAAQTSNVAYNAPITLVTDNNISEPVAATAITTGSGITLERHATGETDIRPLKVFYYDAGTGSVPTVGETVTSGSATGVVVEYLGDAISGTLVVDNWNGTEFTNNTAITGGTSSFSALTDTTGFYQEYTWEINASSNSLQVVYDYLAAKMTQSTLDAIFADVHRWGRTEQTQLLYNGASGYYTNRNVALTEGVWIANRGAGDVAYFTSDAGVQYIPPQSYQFELTGLKDGTEVRIHEVGTGTVIAGVEDITAGTPTDATSGVSTLGTTDNNTFRYSYIFTGNIDIYVVVLNLDYQYYKIDGLTLSNSDQSIPVAQIFDRNYSNP